MGTTIRREPVNFKIPKNEKFKYLNITDFRGISKSSNPLTEQYNTASDALNVYVDETNALTTRPRLEKFADLKSVTSTPSTSEFVLESVFNLLDGFLIQYKTKASGATSYTWGLYIKKTGTGSGTVTNGNNVTAKITSVFEQDNKIYFINGVNYYVIDNGSVSAVTGYIPTAIVGSTLNNRGSEYESLNLLINKYNESYFWDGSWNFKKVMKSGDTVENKYMTTTNPDRSVAITKIFRYLESNPTVALCSTSNSINHLYFRGCINSSNDSNTYDLSNYTAPSHTELYGDCSSDGASYVYYYKDSDYDSSSVNGGVYVYNNSKWYELVRDTSKNCTLSQYSEDEEYVVRANIDCSIIACAYKYSGNSCYVDVFRYKASTDSYENIVHQLFSDNDTVYVNLSRNGNTLIVNCVNAQKVYYITGLKNISSGSSITSTLTEGVCNVVISSDGTMIYTYNSGQSNSFLYNIENGFNKTALNKGFVRNACFSEENDRLLLSFINSGSISPSTDDCWLNIQNMEFIPTGSLNSLTNKSPMMFFSHDAIVVKTPVMTSLSCVYKTFDFSSTEPLLIITRTLSSDDTNYIEWNANKPRKSKLVTRFNNEHWFASGNKTFYTQYNDPSYIPMTSYNINGDQDEITGMNVLSDSILALYKKDDLWLVNQAYDSDGKVQYYYNENNNVVGNNAFGAAITTIHSNLPIQITYDGIYTIQQQENVAAPDRLARSISDAVGELWIAEPDTYKAEAQTLNRLYWTYILIKGKSNPSLTDPDITKVYLLDNRTLSWYYWELPLVLVSSFVKDNVVYLADTENRLSVLKSSDLTKILSDRASISEYYDFDRQVIDWYWQSQILPLGTINYTKKLVNTTFIVTDTDENDGYSLQYQFNVYRRKMGATNVKNVTNKLNYVQSVTKKTFISRFNFLQVKLFNMKDDLDNNKLRLVGLGLKYVLLEGML